MAEIINFLSNATVLGILVAYVFTIWAGLVIWTWVDISRRTDNWFYRYAMAFLVAIGAFVGFAFYLMIRPSLTKKEIDSQKLEEQFLLSTSSFTICPKCSEVAAENFLFCPRCATSLKNKCTNCGFLLNSAWSACPNCGTLQQAIPTLSVIAQNPLQGEKPKLTLPNIGVTISALVSSLHNLQPTAVKEEPKRKKIVSEDGNKASKPKKQAKKTRVAKK